MFFGIEFNKIVRSHEALILGVLVGIIVGVILMALLNVSIKHEKLTSAITLCGNVNNIDSIIVSNTGKIQKIVCMDQRVFSNF